MSTRDKGGVVRVGKERMNESRKGGRGRSLGKEVLAICVTFSFFEGIGSASISVDGERGSRGEQEHGTVGNVNRMLNSEAGAEQLGWRRIGCRVMGTDGQEQEQAVRAEGGARGLLSRVQGEPTLGSGRSQRDAHTTDCDAGGTWGRHWSRIVPHALLVQMLGLVS